MEENTRFLYDDEIGCISLLNTMGSDKCIADSARVSFNKDEFKEKKLGDRDLKLIKYLAKNKHTSPFEHCAMTFRVKVPLGVARHHMRHRTWSFNEVSRRYTSENVEIYSPTKFRTQHKHSRQASTKELSDPILKTVHGRTLIYASTASSLVREHMAASLKLYTDLLDAGVAREQARLVLPQGMYTEYWCTANLLNIIKFLKLRLPKESQWETRRLAEEMSIFVSQNFPEAYKACIQTDLN